MTVLGKGAHRVLHSTPCAFLHVRHPGQKDRDIRTLANAATEDPKNVIDIPVLTSLYDIARHLTNIAKRMEM